MSIFDKNNIYNRIHNFKRGKGPGNIDKLDLSITNSLLSILNKATYNNKIHLAYSGGVDSSIILSKLVSLKIDVIAHTMVNDSNHPDLKYSLKFCIKNEIPLIIHSNLPRDKDLDDFKNIYVNYNEIDTYYMLFKQISKFSKKIICCDCIDELMCGYYNHLRDSYYDDVFLSELIPKHLDFIEQCSKFFNLKVFLPYANKEVFNCASEFNINELINKKLLLRKIPIYKIAKKNNIPDGIIKRRKLGLISSLTWKKIKKGE